MKRDRISILSDNRKNSYGSTLSTCNSVVQCVKMQGGGSNESDKKKGFYHFNINFLLSNV